MVAKKTSNGISQLANVDPSRFHCYESHTWFEPLEEYDCHMIVRVFGVLVVYFSLNLGP